MYHSLKMMEATYWLPQSQDWEHKVGDPRSILMEASRAVRGGKVQTPIAEAWSKSRTMCLNLKKAAYEARQQSRANIHKPVILPRGSGWDKKSKELLADMKKGYARLTNPARFCGELVGGNPWRNGEGLCQSGSPLYIRAEEIFSTLWEACEAGFGIYHFDGRINKAEAKRFRNLTMKIEELCDLYRKEAKDWRDSQNDADAVKKYAADAFPLGSLITLGTDWEWIGDPQVAYYVRKHMAEDPKHADKFRFFERLGVVSAHLALEVNSHRKRTSKDIFYPGIQVLEGSQHEEWHIWEERTHPHSGSDVKRIPKLITDIPKRAENDEEADAKAADKVS